MYAIIKGNPDDENYNVVCNPSTGEPMLFDDMLDAETFAEDYGFTGADVQVLDIDPDKLKEA
jgi:hypothetical protein